MRSRGTTSIRRARQQQKGLLCALLLVCVLVSAACSSNDDSARRIPNPSAAAGPGALHIEAGRLRELRAVASPAEQAAFQDGIVEYSEYEAVVLATISCIQEAGASIVSVKSAIGTRSAAYDLAESTPGHRVTARGKILYSAVGNSDFDPDLAKRVRDCKLQSAAIESIWSEHVAPDENERREMRKMTSECLRALGHEAPDSPSDDDLARIAFPPDGKAAPNQAPPEWFEQCELQTALAFDVS